MSESLHPNYYLDDDTPSDLTSEQRFLRKQRARVEAERDGLLARLDELTMRSREKIPFVERVMMLGARARLYTALNKLDFDLRAISEQESSASNRYTYVAPIELPDHDEPSEQ